jgi:hypothetical protein
LQAVKKRPKTVEQWTGIKVSVGVAPTKVLANWRIVYPKINKNELCNGTGHLREDHWSFAEDAGRDIQSRMAICPKIKRVRGFMMHCN